MCRFSEFLSPGPARATSPTSRLSLPSHSSLCKTLSRTSFNRSYQCFPANALGQTRRLLQGCCRSRSSLSPSS